MNHFEIGTLTTPLPAAYSKLQPRPITDAINISYPSRLEAMALDPSKIELRDDMKYPAGQVDICVDATRTIGIQLANQDEVSVGAGAHNKVLARHALSIMKQALHFEDGIAVNVTEDSIPRHCGLGSSSSLIAGVCAAINELFGLPINPLDLARFSAQNHGEEIDANNNMLAPVQCIGGSAVCGMFPGSLVVVAGESTPIYRGLLPPETSVVLGVPRDYEHPDSESLLGSEIENMQGFVNTGEAHGQNVAYRLIHEVLPGLVGSDYSPLKQLVFDYRWRMGSIANCSFTYPPMMDIAAELAHHENEPTTTMIALSSVGPGFFVITSDPLMVSREFEEMDMKVTTYTPWEDTYKVLPREGMCNDNS